jgi:hypothetical protein
MAETTMKNKKDTKCKRTADSAVAGLTGSSLLTLLRSLLTLHRSLLKKKRQKAIALQSLMWQASKGIKRQGIKRPVFVCVCVCVYRQEGKAEVCIYVRICIHIYRGEPAGIYI